MTEANSTSNLSEYDPVPAIARELSLPPQGVRAVVKLLAEGSTVPFIARYRKEATGSLDEVQIRNIEERRSYLLELEERRRTILESIASQGKLTDELKKRILACDTKAALEDLYLPYKPKRRTRAIIARERGLEPLALRILAQPAAGNPAREAERLRVAREGSARRFRLHFRARATSSPRHSPRTPMPAPACAPPSPSAACWFPRRRQASAMRPPSSSSTTSSARR